MNNLFPGLSLALFLLASCAPQRDDRSFFVLQTEDAIFSAQEKSKKAELLRNENEELLREIESTLAELREHIEKTEKTGRTCSAPLQYRRR